MTFCEFSHYTANQRATNLCTTFLLVITLLLLLGTSYPILITRVSRLSTSVVVRTQ